MEKVIQSYSLLHQLFEEQVVKQPDALAVKMGNFSLSYRELSAHANQIAHQLLSFNVLPNQLVAVVMEKGWEQVAAVLGILKAGAAYLPIDPSESSERLNLLLEQGEVKYVLTQKKYQDVLSWPTQTKQLVVGSSQFTKVDSNLTFQKQAPTDLAYVIFTSGSTGMPKGVMLDHQAVINTIRDINDRFSVNATDKIFALSSLTFDLSVYDIFGAFEKGASIIMPNPEETKEPGAWLDLIINNRSTIWNSAPALMQMLMDYIVGHQGLYAQLECFSFLRLVLLSGDWIPIGLPDKIRRVFKNAQVISLGGATEAAIWSILYPIQTVDLTWKSIPYGKPMMNQSFYILDEHLQAVETGEIDQLYIGGTGLAKGYWRDEKRTNENFIHHPSYGRLYKTGDKGRFLVDGNIEFLGRVAQQVKIRGYGVELSAIEHCLLDYSSISKAVVTDRKDEMGHHDLVAYIGTDFFEVSSPERKIFQKELEKERLRFWETIYDQVDMACGTNDNPLFNFSGWNSSYTGKAIPMEQMQEWAETTVKRILALKPKRLLEIGCGTGLLFFRLLPFIERYTGSDFSSSALQCIRNYSQELSQNKLTLYHRSADIITENEKASYDMVVLNSVIQYFPSADYLVDVLKIAVEATAPGGKIFIGDVRSFLHFEAFHSAVQLYKTDREASFSQWKARVQHHMVEEEELLVDPEFFRVFAEFNPRITHYHIELKRGKYHNEMNCFRYDVTFYVDAVQPDFPSFKWHAFQKNQDSIATICQKLVAEKPPVLAITDIPNARLAGVDMLMQYSLKNNKNTHLSELYEKMHQAQQEAVDPEALAELADTLGYKIQLTWPKTKALGAYDVIFYCADLPHPLGAALEKSQITNYLEWEWSQYTNAPLKSAYLQWLTPQLRHYLKTKLPEYMQPSHFVFLNHFPITSNGKIDRQALLPPDYVIQKISSEDTKTELQKAIIAIWLEVLNIESVGIDDRFVDLGGNSLLAVQILVQIHKTFSVKIGVRDLFTLGTTPFKLSQLIESRLESTSEYVHKDNNFNPIEA